MDTLATMPALAMRPRRSAQARFMNVESQFRRKHRRHPSAARELLLLLRGESQSRPLAALGMTVSGAFSAAARVRP